jgi:protein required for attachment to host cells
MANLKKDLVPRKRIVTWILVADGARARVLANDGPGKGLADAFDRDFIGVNKLMREQVSDRPGHGQESANSARHAIEPKTEWHRFEKHQFAKRMAEILEKAAKQDAFDRLVLVAPPQALGDLRSELGPHAQKKLTGELDKDLTHVALHDLASHLAKLMRL